MTLENKRVAGLSIIVLLAVIAFAAAIATTSAGGNPTLVSGNPDCTDVRSDLLEAIKLEDAADLAAGTYPLPELVNGVQYSVTLLNVTFNSDTPPELIGFDWTSTLGIDAVIVKASNNANVYTYNEATGDTGLVPPAGHAISHITFCYDKEVATDTPTATPVTPTATPVTPTSTPVTPTSTPVTPTSTPVTPTSTPVTPTSTPVTPTSTPVTPTSTPVTPTSTPGTPTSTPVTPTPTPVTPTATPTETPFSEVSPTVVAPTDTPVPPTDTPVPESTVLGTVVGPETGVAGGTGGSDANGGLWALIGAMFATSLAGMTVFALRYVRAR